MQTHPLRIILKALLLFAAVNLLFAWLEPPVQKLTLHNNLLPGRLRFNFGGGYEDYDITIDELDTLFASHEISAGPKPADELRVIVLGDSSVWGELLSAHETLPAQLNRVNLRCGQKRLRFYNLGYPHPFALKDLVILQRALAYDPDLILWPLTFNTIRTKEPNPFLLTNAVEALQIVERYKIPYENADWLQPRAAPWWEKTIIGQRSRLARLFLAQWYGLYWAAGVEYNPAPGTVAPVPEDVSDKLLIGGLEPPANIARISLPQLLDAGHSMAGNIPILLVNEPMFIATGQNRDARYNSFYPRWAYNQFRALMNKRAREHGWNYLDAWNAIPNNYFSDTPLHLNAQGEALLAKMLTPRILNTLCRP